VSEASGHSSTATARAAITAGRRLGRSRSIDSLMRPPRSDSRFAAALVNERYLSRRFTITELARELRVSPLTLRLRFRRFYGLALDEHLALRRLELATVLMSHAPHRVGALDDIARRSGYADVAALDRDFVRYRRTPALAAWFRMGSSRSSLTDEPA